MERNYWLHRISYKTNVSYPLLFDEGRESFLSIGWGVVAEKFPDIRDSENIGNLDFYKKCIKESYGEYYSTSLWNFIHFKKNDLIVVPTYNKDFAVCEILEDKSYTPSEMEQSIIAKYDLGNKDLDLGFFRKVKILTEPKWIPRNGFADKDLTARMKMRQTNANINNIAESVDKAIQNFKDNKPISLYRDLSNEFIKKTLHDIRSELNPNKFEKLIASYFKSLGASIEINPGRNLENKSGDVDILATFEALKLIICVQAKHHNGYSNEWAVQQILEYGLSKEYMDDGYSRILWVISACDDFTKAAMDEAAKYKVHLINGIEFAKMLLDAGLKVFNIEE